MITPGVKPHRRVGAELRRSRMHSLRWLGRLLHWTEIEVEERPSGPLAEAGAVLTARSPGGKLEEDGGGPDIRIEMLGATPDHAYCLLIHNVEARARETVPFPIHGELLRRPKSAGWEYRLVMRDDNYGLPDRRKIQFMTWYSREGWATQERTVPLGDWLRWRGQADVEEIDKGAGVSMWNERYKKQRPLPFVDQAPG